MNIRRLLAFTMAATMTVTSVPANTITAFAEDEILIREEDEDSGQDEFLVEDDVPEATEASTEPDDTDLEITDLIEEETEQVLSLEEEPDNHALSEEDVYAYLKNKYFFKGGQMPTLSDVVVYYLAGEDKEERMLRGGETDPDYGYTVSAVSGFYNLDDPDVDITELTAGDYGWNVEFAGVTCYLDFTVIDLDTSAATALELVDGCAMRDSFSPNETYLYKFTITDPGAFSFRTWTFTPALLLDADAKTTINADDQGIYHLEEGDYYLYAQTGDRGPWKFDLSKIQKLEEGEQTLTYQFTSQNKWYSLNIPSSGKESEDVSITFSATEYADISLADDYGNLTALKPGEVLTLQTGKDYYVQITNSTNLTTTLNLTVTREEKLRDLQVQTAHTSYGIGFPFNDYSELIISYEWKQEDGSWKEISHRGDEADENGFEIRDLKLLDEENNGLFVRNVPVEEGTYKYQVTFAGKELEGEIAITAPEETEVADIASAETVSTLKGQRKYYRLNVSGGRTYTFSSKDTIFAYWKEGTPDTAYYYGTSGSYSTDFSLTEGTYLVAVTGLSEETEGSLTAYEKEQQLTAGENTITLYPGITRTLLLPVSESDHSYIFDTSDNYYGAVTDEDGTAVADNITAQYVYVPAGKQYYVPVNYKPQNEELVYELTLRDKEIPADLSLSGPDLVFSSLSHVAESVYGVSYTDENEELRTVPYDRNTEEYKLTTAPYWESETGEQYDTWKGREEGLYTLHLFYAGKELTKEVTIASPDPEAMEKYGQTSAYEDGKYGLIRFTQGVSGEDRYILEAVSGSAEVYLDDAEGKTTAIEKDKDVYLFTGSNDYSHVTSWGFVTKEDGTQLRVLKVKQTLTVEVPDEERVWTGSAYEPDVTVKDEGGNEVPSDELTISYSDNTEPGSAEVTVTGKGSYEGSAGSAYFKIKQRDLSGEKVTVKVLPEKFDYDGLSHYPDIKLLYDGTELEEGTDYRRTFLGEQIAAGAYQETDATYSAGRYRLVMTGSGHYTGKREVFFEINKKELTDQNTTITCEPEGELYFNVSTMSPDGTVLKVICEGKKLTAAVDYTVAWEADYKEGLLTATINGKGNYSGTVTWTTQLANADIPDEEDLAAVDESGEIAAGEQQLVRIESNTDTKVFITFEIDEDRRKDGEDVQVYVLDSENECWRAESGHFDPGAYVRKSGTATSYFYVLDLTADKEKALLLPKGVGADVIYAKEADLTGETSYSYGSRTGAAPVILHVQAEKNGTFRFDTASRDMWMQQLVMNENGSAGYGWDNDSRWEQEESGSCIRDLKAGSYYIMFAGKTSANSVAVSAVSAPERIRNFKAEAEICGAGLSWTQSPEPDVHYILYRKTADEEEFSVLTTITDREQTSYHDTGLDAEADYTYKIVAEIGTFAIGESSDECTVTTLKDDKAPEVSWVNEDTRSVGDSAEVKVKAADNVGLNMLSFYIRQEAENAESEGQVIVPGTEENGYVPTLEGWELLDSVVLSGNAAGSKSSQTVLHASDLSPYEDGNYQIKAAAVDVYGNVGLSSTKTWVIDHTAPAKVMGITATATDISVHLNWIDNAEDDRAGYIIEQAGEDGNWTQVQKAASIGSNVTGLVPETTYTYRVRAYDQVGNIGEASASCTVTTEADTVAPVVTAYSPDRANTGKNISMKITAVDEYAVRSIRLQTSADAIEWTDLEGAATDYSEQGIRTTRIFSYTLDTSAYDDGAVYVRAVATDWYGNESETGNSAPYRSYTVDRTAPAKPTGLQISRTEDYEETGYLLVSWDQGTESDLGSYTLQRTENIDDENSWKTVKSGYVLSYYDYETEAGHTYWYRVRVSDQAGNEGEYSEAVSEITEPDANAPIIMSLYPTQSAVVRPDTSTGTVTVQAVVKDNDHIESAEFAWKIGEDAVYTAENKLTVQATGARSELLKAQIPVAKTDDGQVICYRVTAKDISGNESVAAEGSFVPDQTAPVAEQAQAKVQEDRSILISWEGKQEEDLYYYAVYRVNGTRRLIWSSGPTSGQSSYSCIDAADQIAKLEGEITYVIIASDRLGNQSEISTVSDSLPAAEKAVVLPTPQLEVPNLLNVNAAYYFDARGTSSDSEIEEYAYDFGDGTTETGTISRRSHTYTENGNYTVKLTVTDADGDTASIEKLITVRDSSTLSDVSLSVVDDKGKAVPYAGIYLDLGSENQVTMSTDGAGKLNITTSAGMHTIGCYTADYLPVSEDYLLLAGEHVDIQLKIKKDELITGKFEVTRMSLSQIEAMGINIADPANQQVAEVTVHMTYQSLPYRLTFCYNSEGEVLSVDIPEAIPERTLIPTVISTPEARVSGGSTEVTVGGGSWPKAETNVLIALLDVPVQASALKEFFDVKLHIMNNADSDFYVDDCGVELNIPEGLTLIPTKSTQKTSDVSIGTIQGQTSRTVEWILRGDKIGEYDLTADFAGNLRTFNMPVKAQFKTDEDNKIQVVGLTDCKLTLTIPRTITSEGKDGSESYLYYSLELRNQGTVPVNLPSLKGGKGQRIIHEEKDGSTYTVLYSKNDGTVVKGNSFPETLYGGEYMQIDYRWMVDNQYANYELVNYFSEVASGSGLKIEVRVDDDTYQDISIVFKDNGTKELLKGKTLTINGKELQTDAEGAVYLQNMPASSKMTVECQGYYDCVVDTDKILGEEGTHQIALRYIQENYGAQVSTLYYREKSSESKKWQDGFLDSTTVHRGENKTYDLEMTVDWNGSTPGKVCLQLDEKNKVYAEQAVNGVYVFENLKLSDWTGEGDIYAYAITEAGNAGPLVKSNISVSQAPSPIEQILNSKFKISSGLEVTLPDDFPIIGGNTISVNLDNCPLYVEQEKNKVKVGINLDLGDEPSYDLAKKYLDAVDDLADVGDKQRKLKQIFSQVGKFKTYQISEDSGITVSYLGYVEGEITSQGIVWTEGQLGFSLDIYGSKSTQFVDPPVYLSFSLGGKTGITATVKREIADTEVPFRFDMNLTVSPYFKATGGIGVKDIIGVEVTGGVTVTYQNKSAIEYEDLIGEAKVSVKAYAGPFTIIDKELWSGKVSFFERNSETRQTEQTGECQSLYAALYDPDNYAPEIISDYQTELVDIDAENLAAGPVTEDDEGTVIENAYPDARVQLVEAGETRMMIWLSQDPGRASADSTVVVWSVYDKQTKTWSAPKLVDEADDGTADLYPSAYVQGGKIYMIWQNTTKQFGAAEATLRDLGTHSEIETAVYDAKQKKFVINGNIAAAGDSNTVYTDPKYVSDGADMYAVWTANDRGNIFGSEGSNSILASKMTADGWGTPVVLADHLGMLLSYDASVWDETLYVAAAVDKLGDLTTTDGWEILLAGLKGEDVTARYLTDDKVKDSTPAFALEKDCLALVWNHDKTSRRQVIASIDGTDQGRSDSSDPGIGATGKRIQLKSGDESYMLWIGETDESKYTNEIYCSAMNMADGTYGTPVAVTKLNRYITSFQAVSGSDGAIELVYQGRSVKIETDEEGEETPVYGSSNIYSCEIVPQADLSIADNNLFVSGQIYPGAALELDFTVANKGMMPAVGYIVQILTQDGDSEKVVATKNYSAIIESGESRDCTFTYVLPMDFTGKNYTARVSLASGKETYTDDNTVTFALNGSELMLYSLTTDRDDENITIIAKYLNSGSVDLKNIAVEVHEGSPNGPVLSAYSRTISELKAVGLEKASVKVVSITIPLEQLTMLEDTLEFLYITAWNAEVKVTGCTVALKPAQSGGGGDTGETEEPGPVGGDDETETSDGSEPSGDSGNDHETEAPGDGGAGSGSGENGGSSGNVGGNGETVVTDPAACVHNFTGWTVIKEADVFSPNTELGRCSICGAETTRETGSKLTATIKINVSGTLPIKTKQKCNKLVVSGLAKGDYVESWRSADSKIVSVSGTGVLKAGKKAGKKTVISVRTAGGATASFTVKVQKKKVATRKVQVSAKSVSLKVGETYDLNC